MLEGAGQESESSWALTYTVLGSGIELPEPKEVPRPIAVIRRQNSGGGAPRRFRFDGVVTLQRTGHSFYLQDATGGVLVETLEPVQLTTGMQVTVFGIEAMGPHSPFLKYARVQIDPEKPRAVDHRFERCCS